MADFNIAYTITSVNEGGYANVSGDTGGETYAGISRKWFPNWAGWRIVDAHKPLKHNQKIVSKELDQLKKQFYKTEFWDKIAGDKINDQQFANRSYDFAVNSGVVAAIKDMQRSVRFASVDGRISDALIIAINNPLNHLL